MVQEAGHEEYDKLRNLWLNYSFILQPNTRDIPKPLPRGIISNVLPRRLTLLMKCIISF